METASEYGQGLISVQGGHDDVCGERRNHLILLVNILLND